MAVPGLSSVLSLPTFNLPAYSSATASTVGDIARQGPHHGAQKSTNTGTSEFNTSWSKAPSLKFSVLLPAILCFVTVSVFMMLETGLGMQLLGIAATAIRKALYTQRRRHPMRNPGPFRC